MKREPGQRWECECGQELVGAVTINGKVAPITVDPKPNGNVWIGLSKVEHLEVGLEGGKSRWSASPGADGARRVTICAVIAGPLLDLMREKNVGLHLNHFADCPHARRFG